MKHVLVTGTSKGIGHHTVRYLLLQGYRVTGVSRSERDEIRQLVKDHADTYRHITCDLGDFDALEANIIKPVFVKGEAVHGLVCNAALAYDDIVTNLSREALEKMFAVNVTSAMLLTKYAIRNMLLFENAGSIVHVSSISAHTGYKGLAMYAASKGAMEAFSRATAREWGSRRIRSNCVVPGFTDTEMNQSLDDAMRARIYARTALGKPVDKDSIAATIEFLLSDRSASITGQNMFVDSGAI